MPHLATALLASSDVIGFVLFGIFLVAFAALAVVVVTWAVRRDRTARAAWRQRFFSDEPPAGDGDSASEDP